MLSATNDGCAAEKKSGPNWAHLGQNMVENANLSNSYDIAYPNC